jgi:uncharacterized protein YgiM (DUF1202 family)
MARVYSEEEKPLRALTSRFRLLRLRRSSRFAPVTGLPPIALLLAVLLCLSGCKHGGPIGAGEVMYVAAPQANLRDHVATVYNRVGSVSNGERVEVLERQKRFVRVRTAQKVEGWVELRALVPSAIYDQFQQLSKENRSTAVEGHGLTRVELNMHVTPGRETDTLYQLAENSKVELLKRSTAVRATPDEIAAKKAAELARATGEAMKSAPKKSSGTAPQGTPQNTPKSAPTQAQTAGQATAAPNATPSNTPPNAAPKAGTTAGNADEAIPKPMDDWWLVRDQQGRTGWVLARMVDLDIPLDVVQYAEGQRVQAAFVLNTVHDEEKGTIPQYLVLLNENKDGIPYDFNQVRVFTWNLKRHRYETAYREHFIVGYFPATVTQENFGQEGTMPVFTIRRQNADNSIGERKYRVIGNIVRPVVAAGEQTQQAAHSPDEPKKNPKNNSKNKARKSGARRKHKS